MYHPQPPRRSSDWSTTVCFGTIVDLGIETRRGADRDGTLDLEPSSPNFHVNGKVAIGCNHD
jgi:hypothetical protein